jgi:hypothetical protein
MNLKGLIYTKLTWKRLLLLFLVSTLFILIFTNAYLTNQMDEATFQAFVFVVCLIFGIPFIAKIGILIYVIIAQFRILNNKELHSSIVKQIAVKNHNENDSEIDMIIDNLYAIIKKIYPKEKPTRVKLNKNLDVLVIDGINFNLNELIKNQDTTYMEKRIENDLLMNKRIKLDEVERLLNKKIFEEWDVKESVNS